MNIERLYSVLGTFCRDYGNRREYHTTDNRRVPLIALYQYWLVHKCKVDVPAMYDPYGRYRYAYGVVSSPQVVSASYTHILTRVVVR